MNGQIKSLNLMNHILSPIEAGDRLVFLKTYLKDKKVLHIGCTDYPRFDPANNLHIQLSADIDDLHGLDIDTRGLEILRKYVNRKYYSSYDQIDESYDLVLVPEVLEHTLNAGLFLKQLMGIDTKEIMLIAPNAIEIVKSNSSRLGWTDVDTARLYSEIVHLDHTAYYSPVTLTTLVQRAMAEYGNNQWLMGPIFLTGISVGCVLRRVAVNA